MKFVFSDFKDCCKHLCKLVLLQGDQMYDFRFD